MSSTVTDVRREFIDIVGHIDYDDISDLDTNWASLADALKGLPFSRPVKFRTPTWKDAVVALALEDIVAEYPVNLDDLISLAREVEDLSSPGSSDALSEEAKDELQEKIVPFESAFSEFIKRRLPSFLVK